MYYVLSRTCRENLSQKPLSRKPLENRAQSPAPLGVAAVTLAAGAAAARTIHECTVVMHSATTVV